MMRNDIDLTSPASSPALPTAPAREVLEYERIDPAEAARPRPWWVYAVAGIYAFLLLALLSLPGWARWQGQADDNGLVTLAICIGVLTLCGLSLMIIPVRAARRRPITRRSIWIPVIASGLLAAALVLGGGLALCEYFRATDQPAARIVLGASILTWLIWSGVFALVALSGRERSVGMKLHRWLIAGSVLELLVAVPTHVIVRRRQECCAGILTGFGICIGVAIMLVSFGPSVLLLYYRRRKQITGGRPDR